MIYNALKRNSYIWKLVHNCVIKPSASKIYFFIFWSLTLIFLFGQYCSFVTREKIDITSLILIGWYWDYFLQAIIFAFYSKGSSSFINTMKCTRDVFTKKLPFLMQAAGLSTLLLSILSGNAFLWLLKHTPSPVLAKGFIINWLFYNLLISIWIPFTINGAKKGYLKNGWVNFTSIKDAVFSSGIAMAIVLLILPLNSLLTKKGAGLLDGHMGIYVCICLALILLSYAVSRIELTVYYTRHR